jgi:hypothetical protein
MLSSVLRSEKAQVLYKINIYTALNTLNMGGVLKCQQ